MDAPTRVSNGISYNVNTGTNGIRIYPRISVFNGKPGNLAQYFTVYRYEWYTAGNPSANSLSVQKQIMTLLQSLEKRVIVFKS